MKKYIALLRGVNVGGNNKVSMPVLRAALEKAGFCAVSTYINSGNVLFSADQNDIETLQQICRQAILNTFQLDIAVAVLSAGDLHEALAHAPAWWGQDIASKHNAIFVIAPENADSIIASVGQSKPEYEQVSGYGPLIFWSAPLDTFSRTRWSKIVSTSAYNSVTIRNANTTKRLSALAR